MGEEPGPFVRDAAIARDGFRERSLANVTEGRVAKIVSERDGLREVLVEAEGARNGASDLGDLERMDQASSVVIALWGKKHLRLVGETSEALRVEDAVSVTLETRPKKIGLLGMQSADGGV